MIKQICDLHIHLKYSRACSPDLTLPNIALMAKIKGIDIIGTGDFTHPIWFKHIKDSLSEAQPGIYRLKKNKQLINNQTRFILSTEISCIYKHNQKTRRVHLLVLSPSIKSVAQLINKLHQYGANLRSDGRPIIGLSAKALLELILTIDERMIMIPAHIWTPWFSVFGSKSGYDSLTECFEDLTPYIKILETGLSSDPTMNHLIRALDKYSLISNSDAHSLEKLGREANVISFNNDKEITYNNLIKILQLQNKNNFLYTIEFYPEAGRYHADGCADCRLRFTPTETKKNKFVCPQCGKKITIGVNYRVFELADRNKIDLINDKYIPHKYIVPLKEIIAYCFGVGEKSKKVLVEYDKLINNLGSEFNVLLDQSIDNINSISSDQKIAKAIDNIRRGQVKKTAGYDGIYGKIDLLT